MLKSISYNYYDSWSGSLDPMPLMRWFDALKTAAEVCGGILRLSAATASKLLATPRDVMVLHGDIHHGNILDFGPRGWLAIDPKGVSGERSSISSVTPTTRRRRCRAAWRTG